MMDEVQFAVRELCQVRYVLGKVELFGGPECGLMRFVGVPDLLILNWGGIG